MADNKIVANNGSSIVLYSTDDSNIQLEVKLEKDSVWLNREPIAQLYGRDYKTIAKHINNALREELEGEPVVAKFATPKKYGRKEGYTQMHCRQHTCGFDTNDCRKSHRRKRCDGKVVVNLINKNKQ